ncbi:hypothetical protein [Nostoc sp. EfeVER01]|uniref:hypothetical protein n=1 Tax=Nostoc sp. EfeVER01 TaxID=3075406 RepID=UPI00391B6ECE
MPKMVDSSFDRRANHLLRSIQLCGGCVPLHRLQFQFSDSVIQTLLDKELVQVQNRAIRNSQFAVKDKSLGKINYTFCQKIEIPVICSVPPFPS